MVLSCLCFLLGFLTRDLLGHRNSITSYGSLDSNGSRWEYNRNPLHLIRQFYRQYFKQMGVQQKPTLATQIVLQVVLGVQGVQQKSTPPTQVILQGVLKEMGVQWKPTPPTQVVIQGVLGVYRSTMEAHSPTQVVIQVVLGVDGGTIGTHSTYSGSSIGSTWSRSQFLIRQESQLDAVLSTNEPHSCYTQKHVSNVGKS